MIIVYLKEPVEGQIVLRSEKVGWLPMGVVHVQIPASKSYPQGVIYQIPIWNVIAVVVPPKQVTIPELITGHG